MYKYLFSFLGLSLIALSTAFGERSDGYYSQCLQDKFLNETIFHNRSEGFFVDIGAHNGVSFSNTKFFEELGWQGICVEPIPEVFEKLIKNRNAHCIQGCIANKTGKAQFLRVRGYSEMLSGLVDKYDPRHLARVRSEVAHPPSGKASAEIIEVDCFLLNDIFRDRGVEHIDLLSLDTEGGELEILQSIDFDRYCIDFIDVENNFNEKGIREFMMSKGYVLIWTTGFDDIYQRRAMKYPTYPAQKRAKRG